MNRRAFLPAVIAALTAISPAGGRERRHHGAGGTPVTEPEIGGLSPGRYTVKILAPILSPALDIEEQVFSICYTKADARGHANPVMPAAQAARCPTSTVGLTDELVFDNYCQDGQHRLRMIQINEASYQGTYRFVAAGKNGFMLEPAVQMRREGDCG